MNRFKLLIAMWFIMDNAAAYQQGTRLRLHYQSGLFSYFAYEQDSSAVRQISALMNSASLNVSQNLGMEYKHRVIVEIYPDQQAYDENIMNPEMRGTPALSGSYRIQMVSPNSPIAVQGIPYQQRLQFAVHEFTHLVIDEISDDVPLWLHEGMACYEGSHSVYTFVCRHAFPKGNVPTIEALTRSYNQIPAADVYPFSLVEFLIERFGRTKVNEFLGHSQNPQKIFKVTASEIHQEWKTFIASHYVSETQ